ncbi:uncharacterized protein [Penaeus vannamei]|uniref:uncharacterized protein n=1 Tax=Penaeus vannamei TaxID=6689 RepID=UPI00387F6A63
MKGLFNWKRLSRPRFRKIAKVLYECALPQNASPDENTEYTCPVLHRVEAAQSYYEERRELCRRLGWRRRECVRYTCQSDYVMVHAAADEHHARLIRRKLESSVSDVVVLGPWSIGLGDQIFDAWERMLRNTTTVLVLVSRALCSERLPAMTSMAAVMGTVMVVPIFLEDIPRGGLPDGLNMLRYRQGVDLYRLGCDASVAELARHTAVATRYARECAALRELLSPRRAAQRLWYSYLP